MAEKFPDDAIPVSELQTLCRVRDRRKLAKVLAEKLPGMTLDAARQAMSRGYVSGKYRDELSRLSQQNATLENGDDSRLGFSFSWSFTLRQLREFLVGNSDVPVSADQIRALFPHGVGAPPSQQGLAAAAANGRESAGPGKTDAG